jgi:hypothetical protein
MAMLNNQRVTSGYLTVRHGKSTHATNFGSHHLFRLVPWLNHGELFDHVTGNLHGIGAASECQLHQKGNFHTRPGKHRKSYAMAESK